MSADLARRVRKYIDRYIVLNPRETGNMGWDDGRASGEAAVAKSLTRIVGEKADNDDYGIYMMGDSDYQRLHFEVAHKLVSTSTSYLVRKGEGRSPVWYVHAEDNTRIGSVSLTFDTHVGDATIGFGWSDGDVQAGFELEFNEAVRMLAIIHRRKCAIDSE